MKPDTPSRSVIFATALRSPKAAGKLSIWVNHARTSLFHFCRRSAPGALDWRVTLSFRTGGNHPSRRPPAGHPDRVGQRGSTTGGLRYSRANRSRSRSCSGNSAASAGARRGKPACHARPAYGTAPNPRIAYEDTAQENENRKATRSSENGRQSSGVSAFPSGFSVFPLNLVNLEFGHPADFVELHEAVTRRTPILFKVGLGNHQSDLARAPSSF
jgi:hypothetical protein